MPLKNQTKQNQVTIQYSRSFRSLSEILLEIKVNIKLDELRLCLPFFSFFFTHKFMPKSTRVIKKNSSHESKQRKS